MSNPLTKKKEPHLMANYFTQFSCLLDLGTVDNVTTAIDLYDISTEEENGCNFTTEFSVSAGGTELWIYGTETRQAQNPRQHHDRDLVA
jgi:hypothetical protein